MKKSRFFFIIAVLIVVMTGCGTDKVTENENKTDKTDKTDKKSEKLNKQDKEEIIDDGKDEIQETDSFVPAVMIDENVIIPGEVYNFSDIAYDDMAVIPGFDDMAKERCYICNGITLFTEETESGEMVYLVEITEGELINHIKPGDQVDILKETYGNDLVSEDDLGDYILEEKSGEMDAGSISMNEETVSDNEAIENLAEENEEINYEYYSYTKDNVTVLFEVCDGMITYMEIF